MGSKIRILNLPHKKLPDSPHIFTRLQYGHYATAHRSHAFKFLD